MTDPTDPLSRLSADDLAELVRIAPGAVLEVPHHSLSNRAVNDLVRRVGLRLTLRLQEVAAGQMLQVPMPQPLPGTPPAPTGFAERVRKVLTRAPAAPAETEDELRARVAGGLTGPVPVPCAGDVVPTDVTRALAALAIHLAGPEGDPVRILTGAITLVQARQLRQGSAA
jgi:hypothetical protein